MPYSTNPNTLRTQGLNDLIAGKVDQFTDLVDQFKQSVAEEIAAAIAPHIDQNGEPAVDVDKLADRLSGVSESLNEAVGALDGIAADLKGEQGEGEQSQGEGEGFTRPQPYPYPEGPTPRPMPLPQDRTSLIGAPGSMGAAAAGVAGGFASQSGTSGAGEGEGEGSGESSLSTLVQALRQR